MFVYINISCILTYQLTKTMKNLISEHQQEKKELSRLGWGVRSYKFSESFKQKIITYGITPESYLDALEWLEIQEGEVIIAFDVIVKGGSKVIYVSMNETELSKLAQVEPIAHEGYDHEEEITSYTYEYNLNAFSQDELKDLFNEHLNIAQ